MNLKPDLQQALTILGVSDDELVLLRERMLSTVTGLEASLGALDAQISTLTAQRDAVAAELARASITVAKLVDPAVPKTEAKPVTGA